MFIEKSTLHIIIFGRFPLHVFNTMLAMVIAKDMHDGNVVSSAPYYVLGVDVASVSVTYRRV